MEKASILVGGLQNEYFWSQELSFNTAAQRRVSWSLEVTDRTFHQLV